MMARITTLAIGLTLVAGIASAQLDCGPGGSLCATTKYGLGEFPNFRFDKVPVEENLFDFDHADFGPDFGGVSYFLSRGSFTSGNPNCGPERGFFPLPGQIILRERTDCVPTGTGPTCAGGINAGQPCHLVPPSGTVAGYVNQFTPIECPGSSCQDNGGGCRVEIPISDGGGVPGGGWTPPANASDAAIVTLAVGFGPDPFVLNAHTANTWGGSSTGFCTGGPTPDADCRSNADCGAGGTCTLAKGNCQAGPTPGARCTNDGQCGAGGTCNLVACSPTNFRVKPSMGTRYILPASRGGDGTMTYVRWDYGQVDANVRTSLSTALRTHGDDAVTCCASTPGTCSNVVPGSPAYPLLNVRTCAVPGRFSYEDNVTNDWIFEGGRGTRFHTDRNHVLPGQLVGVCLNNRSVPCTSAAANARCTGSGAPYACCTGGGAGSCGTECNALGDTCDLREPGHRAQIVLGRDAFGDPRPTACNANSYVLRGTPNQGCTLTPSYLVPGDPGSDCGLFNFGRDRRYDADCNGVADFQDGCPFNGEWDQDKDTDGDCSDGVGGDCRLDECECGDQDGNGRVNVSDLVAINVAIFSGTYRRLCDGNSDLICNISDLVAANVEIFNPDSSTCRHITSSRCGNNVVDPGEVCDDGARCHLNGVPTATACDATGPNTCPVGELCRRVGGDGCNTSCRLE
jgi:hypothetical protein